MSATRSNPGLGLLVPVAPALAYAVAYALVGVGALLGGYLAVELLGLSFATGYGPPLALDLPTLSLSVWVRTAAWTAVLPGVGLALYAVHRRPRPQRLGRARYAPFGLWIAFAFAWWPLVALVGSPAGAALDAFGVGLALATAARVRRTAGRSVVFLAPLVAWLVVSLYAGLAGWLG